jgi:hypothetical protein
MKTKNKITLKTIFGDVLWESSKETVTEAVKEKYARDANLRDANLRDANLRDANLRGADLRGADLRGADLWQLPRDFINQASRDILFILSCLKSEVPALKKMLIEGKVDGTQYEGDCACLIGSLANADGGMKKVCETIPFYEKGLHNLGENFFLAIHKGDTPETNQFSAHAVKLCEMVEKKKYYTIQYDPTPEQLAEWENKREELKKSL